MEKRKLPDVVTLGSRSFDLLITSGKPSSGAASALNADVVNSPGARVLLYKIITNDLSKMSKENEKLREENKILLDKIKTLSNKSISISQICSDLFKLILGG